MTKAVITEKTQTSTDLSKSDSMNILETVISLMKRLVLTGLILLYVAVCNASEWKTVDEPSSPDKAKNKPLISPIFTKTIRNKGRNLYNSLLIMKREKDFIGSGYGKSPSQVKYKKWDSDVNALHIECSAELDKLDLPQKVQSELLDVCTATTHLSVLGMHYAMNGCIDDRSAQIDIKAIKSAFKIK
jgi:hypothetical protein